MTSSVRHALAARLPYFVIAAAAILFLARLGDLSVISEETRWAEVAREMRDSGDYFTPTLNGKPYYDKPLGSYWLIVLASYVTGGVNATAARLPSACAGLLGVWVVMRLATKAYDQRVGALAGAILATSFGYAFYARRATADMETATGALLLVWYVDRSRGQSQGGAWVAALWVGMALVSLMKGLLGFALPLAVLGTDAVLAGWQARGESGPIHGCASACRWLWTRWTFLGILLAFAVYLVPFLVSARSMGSTVGLDMVWRENIQRFVRPHNHTGPIYLYAGALFVLAAPWSVFLPSALLGPTKWSDPRQRLMAAYFWGVLLFFTVSASRRSYYLLPILPPTSVLLAKVLMAPAPSLGTWCRRMRDTGWLALGAVTVLVGLALLPPSWWLPPPFDELPPLPARAGLAVLWFAAMASLAILGARSRHNQRARPSVAAPLTVLFFLYGFGVVLPELESWRTRRAFLEQVRAITEREPDKLLLYQADDVVFDLGHKVASCAAESEYLAAIRAGTTRWVLSSRRHIEPLPVAMIVVLEEPARPWERDLHHQNKLLLVEQGASDASLKTDPPNGQ